MVKRYIREHLDEPGIRLFRRGQRFGRVLGDVFDTDQKYDERQDQEGQPDEPEQHVVLEHQEEVHEAEDSGKTSAHDLDAYQGLERIHRQNSDSEVATAVVPEKRSRQGEYPIPEG